MISSGIDFLWVHLMMSGLFIIIGLHYMLNQPKDMKLPVGLNLPISTNAQLNMDTWIEFHKYSGKIMAISGSVYFLGSLILNYLVQFSQLPSSKMEGLNIALTIISTMAIVLIIPVFTGNHTHKTFDKEGNRKEKHS